MINTPKDIPLHAIRRLKQEEDFQHFLTWLETEHTELYKKLVASDVPHTPKLQGAISVVDEILRVVREADKIVAKRTK